MTIKVLFVCAGNICRSPMADALFQHMVKQAGLQDKIMVDSAGTGSWHIGEIAHAGTRKVLQKHNIPYNGRARQLKPQDLDEFDYVLAMDAANMEGIRRYAPEAENPHHNSFTRAGQRHELSLFLHHAKQAGIVKESHVPDPYYDGKFDEVYDLVMKGSAALLKHIRQQQGL